MLGLLPSSCPSALPAQDDDSAAPPRIATSLHPGVWLGLDHHPETKEGQSIGGTYLEASKHIGCAVAKSVQRHMTMTTTPCSPSMHPPAVVFCRCRLRCRCAMLMALVQLQLQLLYGALWYACSGCGHSSYLTISERPAIVHKKSMYRKPTERP